MARALAFIYSEQRVRLGGLTGDVVVVGEREWFHQTAGKKSVDSRDDCRSLCFVLFHSSSIVSPPYLRSSSIAYYTTSKKLQ